jgi:hypothetical protein
MGNKMQKAHKIKSKHTESVILYASALFFVQHVPHSLAAGRIQLRVGARKSALVGVFLFRFAAGRAAIGKAGLVRLQFEFITTNGAGTDGEWHNRFILKPKFEVFVAKISCSFSLKQILCTHPGPFTPTSS